MSFLRARIYRSPDEGGNGGGGSDAGTQQKAQQPVQPNGNGAGGGFTSEQQEQINRLVGDARKKGRDTAVSDLLGELGLTTADDLKALVTTAHEQQQAQLTEAQRLQKELDKFKPFKEQVESLQQRLTQADEAIAAQVKAQVKALNVPKYVVALLDAMTPMAQLAYLAENAEAFKTAATTPPDTDAGRRGGNNGKGPDEATLRARYSL